MIFIYICITHWTAIHKYTQEGKAGRKCVIHVAAIVHTTCAQYAAMYTRYRPSCFYQDLTLQADMRQDILYYDDMYDIMTRNLITRSVLILYLVLTGEQWSDCFGKKWAYCEEVWLMFCDCSWRTRVTLRSRHCNGSRTISITGRWVHDDVMTWKRFSHHRPLVMEIHKKYGILMIILSSNWIK